MTTSEQSESNARQAVFGSNAKFFTTPFLQTPTTTTWESNLTLNAQDQRLFTPDVTLVLGAAPDDRQLFFETVTKMNSATGFPPDFNNTLNSSNSFVYINLTQSKLCGLPAFCSNQASTLCQNVTLNQCEECSMTGAGIFAAICIIVGFLIVLGNGMVVCVIIKNRLNDGFSMMKVSLAVTDALTGVQLLVAFLYNFNETIYNTAAYLDNRQLHLRGSPKAVAGGSFFLLTITSSLYHLTFMSGQRFYAIKWPLKYRMNDRISVRAGLLAIWILSILSATVPAWFPHHLLFTYQHLLFMFYISAQPSVATNHSAIIMVMIIFFVIPFLFMSILSMGTALLVLLTRRRSAVLLERTNRKRAGSNKKEVAVFVTVAMMQTGFSLTIIPLIVVNSLYFGGYLDCSNVALPFTISFYLCIANSLVNVLVYSIRDKRFRKYAVDFLLPRYLKKQEVKKQGTATRTATNTTSA